MKVRIAILFYFIFSTSIIAQQYSKNENRSDKKLKERKVSYLKFNKESNKDGHYSFYMNKIKRIEGEYVNKKKENLWKFYNLNGELIIEGYFNENNKNGQWLYYRNSKLISKVNYDNDILNGITLGFFENGDTACVKMYKSGLLDGEYKTFYKNNILKSIGFYKDGYKIETWIDFDKEGNIKEQKVYTEKDIDNFNDEVYFVPEIIPENYEFMRNYVQTKLMKYPKEASEKNIKGIVFVTYVVNRLGFVENVEIAKGVHPILDKVSISAIKKLPSWEPGYQNNVPVKVKFTFPLNYMF